MKNMLVRLKLNSRLTVLAVLVTISVAALASRTQALTQVDVGGHSLRVLKIEGGGPTIVFENGLRNPLESWVDVQASVSSFATSVSYDRATTGGSEDGPLPRDARQVATELHIMLQNTDTPPPYILVGASLGGLFVRTYAAMYANEVSALVLVDPASDAEIEFQVDEESSGVPEIDAFPLIKEQARENAVPPEIPIYLIAAMGFQESPYLAAVSDKAQKEYEEANIQKLAGYRKWLDARANTQLIVTNKSRHLVSHEQPELIVAAIREVIELIK